MGILGERRRIVISYRGNDVHRVFFFCYDFAEFVASLESLINEIATEKVSLVVQVCFPTFHPKALMHRLNLFIMYYATEELLTFDVLLRDTFHQLLSNMLAIFRESSMI